ncbi:MAG: transglycosylase SLT domain-containing protein [candidate division Zixibacteria bacterium]|nr:transglycosylase SLT domain-containing protein [candidate division Zixibacteria bacterium]
MNTLLPTIQHGLKNPSKLNSLMKSKSQSIEQKKSKLRKATKQFESLFMYQILKAMRKTVKENSLTQDGSFSDSFGKDTFMDMFDVHLAEKMSGGPHSISNILYNSLVESIEPSSNSFESSGTVHDLPLDKRNTVPLQKKMFELDSNPVRPKISVKVNPVRDLERTEMPQQSSSDSIISQYGHIINEAATANKVDSALICAVIRTESGGNPNAVSSAGAKGLMQLMDSTATEMGMNSAFDPHQNIHCGVKYLRKQLDRFGDLRLAVAAYNAGPGSVERYQGIPPFSETEEYVNRVMDAVKSYRKIMSPDNAKVVSHFSR